MAINLILSIFLAICGAGSAFVATQSFGLAFVAYVLFGMVALVAISVLRAEGDDSAPHAPQAQIAQASS